MSEIHLPREAIIKERIQESPTLFTLRLAYADGAADEPFEFQPGQFNMLSLHGVGEIPISIVSDPEEVHFFECSLGSSIRHRRSSTSHDC